MINKFVLTVIVMTVMFLDAYSQREQQSDTTGIRFESGLSWKQILSKAKTENKYIFVDCYATWCGPCRWMENNVYPEKEVGNFYNANFINVSVQMDSMANDNKAVRNWYGDAKMIKNKFNVHSYPTYLVYGPDGQIVHRFDGSVEKEGFILKGKNAKDPQKQYYTVVKDLKTHKDDSVYLLKILQQAIHQNDTGNQSEIANYYLNSLKDTVSKETIYAISPLVWSGYERGFCLFLNNAAKINRITADSLFVEQAVAGPIAVKEIFPFQTQENMPFLWQKTQVSLLSKYSMLSPRFIENIKMQFEREVDSELRTYIYQTDTATVKNWDAILKRFMNKYIDYAIEPSFMLRKVQYYGMKKKWADCANAAYEYIHRYGDQISIGKMNDICWAFIFLHSGDKKILAEAIKHMEHLIRVTPNDLVAVDTYANLLYKTGKKQEAIIWCNKTVELTKALIEAERIKGKEPRNSILARLKEYQATLDKMEKDMPTWEDAAVEIATAR